MKNFNEAPNKMVVTNKPKISYLQESIRFLWSSKRKKAILALVLLLPVVEKLWMVFPEIPHPEHGTLDVFVWLIGVHFSMVILGAGWYLTQLRKDRSSRFIALSVVVYGVLLTLQVIGSGAETPLWIDLLAAVVVLIVLHISLEHMRNKYLSSPNDYQPLYENAMNDLNYQRFLGRVDRIEGLLEIAQVEERAKKTCQYDIDQLRKSLAYIAEKYESDY